MIELLQLALTLWFIALIGSIVLYIGTRLALWIIFGPKPRKTY